MWTYSKYSDFIRWMTLTYTEHLDYDKIFQNTWGILSRLLKRDKNLCSQMEIRREKDYEPLASHDVFTSSQLWWWVPVYTLADLSSLGNCVKRQVTCLVGLKMVLPLVMRNMIRWSSVAFFAFMLFLWDGEGIQNWQ